MSVDVPVVLFVYARPDHLRRVLEGLKVNCVPLLYVFCDGPKTPKIASKVVEVRGIIRSVDWCDVRIVERDTNLGLGESVRTGVQYVLSLHDRLLVFEDDIIPLAGAYAYLCAALETYANDTRVMSVAAWTHPAVRPSITNDQPYFDGRFACWGWGTWRRAWQGMDRSALELMQQCRRPDRYGQDLVHMARHEIAANLWAVRFAMLHFLRKGLCLHPPETMVVNIGFDEFGTNIKSDQTWRQEIPERTPAIPDVWPIPLEHPDAAALWRKVCGEQSPLLHDIRRAVSRKLARIWYGCRLMTDFSGLHSHYLRRAVRDACRRLSEKQISVAIDYGCGERPYDNELRSIAGKVVGLDLGENPLADIRIDPKGSIPIQSASVSLVTTFQVLEHVPDPTSYLGEIGRVCRCGGHLLLSVPSIWPYHPHPTDFRRWMIDGLVYDLRTAGFEVEQTWSVLNPVSATIQYILAIAQYATMRWNRWVRPWTIPAVVFLNVMIVLSEKIFQRSMRYGAGNYVVLARRVPDNS